MIVVDVLHFLNSIFLIKRALLGTILFTYSLLKANSMKVFLLNSTLFRKRRTILIIYHEY